MSKEDDEEYYPATTDRSHNVLIVTNSEGKKFAIRNIRQTFDGNKMNMIADIAGDLEAGDEYIKLLGENLVNGLEVMK